MNKIHKITCPEEGLRYLSAQYGISVPVDLHLETNPAKAELCPCLMMNGKTIPLPTWQQERRFTELKSMAEDGTLQNISSVRSCRIEPTGTSLSRLLYRELDLLEWMIGSPIAYLYTVRSGAAANTAAQLKCGVVCTVETAATLSPDAQIIDKHEIIASVGVALDKAVDTQIQQNSIYVFSDQKEPDTYTDTDFELYGLVPEEIALVRSALDILKNPEQEDVNLRRDAHLRKLVEIALESASGGRKIIVEE